MVRGRVDRIRRPYRKAVERYKRRGLRRLREEQARRGWVVVTGFWPRIENPGVLWRRRRPARPAEEQSRSARERLARLARLILEAPAAAREAARRARTLASLVTRPRELLGIMRRNVYEFAREFARSASEEFAKEAWEWLRESWLWRTYRYVKTRVEFAARVWRLMGEIRRGEAVPLFEAVVETVDGVRVWRVQSIDRMLEMLPAEARQRVIENIVAIVERGRPRYTDWLNPYVRMLLALLVPQLYRDRCHHKGLMVRASPVVLEELDRRGVKRVYVFLRVARIEAMRADPLIGKSARITDPVLEEVAVLKPEEDETSLLNARRAAVPKVATPYTSLHRRLIEYPETLLAIHEAGVRRALALAAGVPEQDGAEGLDPCSVYLAPEHWTTFDDIPEANRMLMSKPGRRRLGVAEPGLRRTPVRTEILEETGLLRLAS